MNVLTVNLVFSTLVFWIAAKLYVFPRLHELQARTVLVPIFLLHSLRHLGLMFLAPGATYRALQASLLTRPHSAICWPQCSPWSLSGLWSRIGRAHVFSYGFLPLKEPLISLQRLRWLNSTELRLLWGPRIGYRHFGFRRCW